MVITKIQFCLTDNFEYQSYAEQWNEYWKDIRMNADKSCPWKATTMINL